MKTLFTLIVVIAAGIGGYFSEPYLRATLAGKTKPMVRKTVEQDDPPVPADDMANAGSEPEIDITPNPVPNQPIADPKSIEIPEASPTPTPVPSPETIPAPEPTPAPSPEPTPAPSPEPTPAPAPEPTPAPAPEPAPEPQPSTAAPPTTTNPIALMQQHIKSGALKEFNVSQVTSWKAGPEETIDGTIFQTGLATYKAKTVFGVKSLEAKALIQNGEIKRWIWSKSGMEIK